MNFIDSSGSAAIKALAEGDGSTVHLAEVKQSIVQVLARDGILDALGSHVHRTVVDAVACARNHPGG